MIATKPEKFLPWYPPINTTPPTKKDLEIDATLNAYMAVNMVLETDDEMARRNEVLQKVEKIFKDWVIKYEPVVEV